MKYSDINLIPRYSTLSSRSEANTQIKFGPRTFNLPVVPANMETVIDEKIAYYLSERNYFYIMHRFGDTLSFIRKANKEGWMTISISVGLQERDRNILYAVKREGLRIDYLTIDVAHGHHQEIRYMIQHIRYLFEKKVFIVVGNVATAKAAEDLEDWGADAVKIGIGGGSACTTKHETGFHVPMVECIERCCVGDLLIVADGGVRYRGDIAKALVIGADMVMCGSLFARCIDSPAEIIDGKKQYYGSASYNCKGEDRHIEGIELRLDSDITYEDQLRKIKEALQSSISYAGGKYLRDLGKVEYVKNS